MIIALFNANLKTISILLLLFNLLWIFKFVPKWEINLHLLAWHAEDGKETTNNEAPENNPQYTTVYVGNLAPQASNCLQQLFYLLFCTCELILKWVQGLA